jgi:hypothetical protein
MELHLDEHEYDVLRELLDSAYRDLRMEIADTDNSVFKANLRARRDTVQSLLHRVGGPLPDR